MIHPWNGHSISFRPDKIQSATAVGVHSTWETKKGQLGDTRRSGGFEKSNMCRLSADPYNIAPCIIIIILYTIG